MTINEILKTKPSYIMRKGWSSPLAVEGKMEFSMDDLMATDWQCPEVQVVVKRSTLQEAWDSEVVSVCGHCKKLDNAFDALCKSLGLDAQ